MEVPIRRQHAVDSFTHLDDVSYVVLSEPATEYICYDDGDQQWVQLVEVVYVALSDATAEINDPTTHHDGCDHEYRHSFGNHNCRGPYFSTESMMESHNARV